MTSPGDRKRLAEAFDRALRLEASARAQFLRELDDPPLVASIERLLQADARESSVLDEGMPQSLLLASPQPSRIGQRVGDFVILRSIGKGGMGSVFEAEQDNPKRRVALKMLERHAWSDADRHRLDYEAELLARLDHPNIARVFAAGTVDLPDGERPYVAMELVTGARSFDAYVREESLRIREIVDLLRQTANALQHAHQRGVIHRDLKPQNILVRQDGALKIIDFGIAHVVGDAKRSQYLAADTTLRGTLHYMAPEQFDSDTSDVRIDIYALGVLLFELLTGTHALELGDRPLPEAIAFVRESRVPPPSTRKRDCPKELDWIVAKATASDPNERYESAEQLARDLSAFLGHGVVEAGSPSALYRARKFVRRNLILVSVSTSALIAVLLGAVFAILGEQRARVAEQRATRSATQAAAELATQEDVTRFLTEMLSVAYPDRDGRNVTLFEILDGAATSLDATTIRSPRVAATLANTLSLCYRSLGLAELSRRENSRALEIASAHLPADHRAVLAAQVGRAFHLRASGDLAGAEALHRKILAQRIATLGEDHLETAESRYEIALALRERNAAEEALTELRAARKTIVDRLGIEHRRAIVCDHAILVTRGDADPKSVIDDARALVTRAERYLGPRHPTTLDTRNSLGTLLLDAGRLEEACTVLRSTCALYGEVYGEKHAATLKRLGNLAGCLVKAEQFAEAESIIRRCLAAKNTGLAALIQKNTLGVCLYKQEKFRESHEVFRELLQAAAPVLGKHWLLGQFRKCFGDALAAAKDYAAAETELRAGLALLEQSFDPKHQRVTRARGALADVLDATGRGDEARAMRTQNSRDG